MKTLIIDHFNNIIVSESIMCLQTEHIILMNETFELHSKTECDNLLMMSDDLSHMNYRSLKEPKGRSQNEVIKDQCV